MNEAIFQILVTIATEELPTKAIRQRIAELSDGTEPPITSFYRSLSVAEDSGWVEVMEAPAPTGGRPTQSYRITEDGREAVRARALELRKLADLVLIDNPAGDRS